MSSPVIWIGLPAFIGVVLWFVQKNERRLLITGLSFSLFFVITALITPIGKPLLQIGSFVFQISPSMSALGRSFNIEKGDLFFAAFIYFILFLFMSMSFIVDIPGKFVPLGFLMSALIMAAISVQPFLYSALLLELCVLLSLVLLCPPGQIPTTGVVRFLIFQTLAMPFMLASGWVLSAVEANPTEITLVFQALGLIGLGFAFWLAVFPFNFWMPQLAGEKPAFLVGFVFLLFNTAILILIMRYLDGFVWLRDDARIFIVLRFLGILMLISSSILFLLERNIFRSTAFLISFETGMSLIALSLNQQLGWNSFASMFIPRIISISLWAASLSHLQQNTYEGEEKDARIIHPIVVGSFLITGLTFTGFPLLPNFVNRITIFESLAGQDLNGFIWVVIATLIFVTACIRFIRNLLNECKLETQAISARMEKGFFVIYISMLGLLGIFPQVFSINALVLLQAFPNLK
jgi:NADH-quinone oxidoreductase subunit N